MTQKIRNVAVFRSFSLSPISFQSDKIAGLFLVFSCGDGCGDGKKLLPLEKVEMRDAVESLYWLEMAYVELPLVLNRSKKIIEAAYIHARPVTRWLNCLEYMRSC